MQTYIDGKLVAENGETLIKSIETIPINQFDRDEISVDDLIIPCNDKKSLPVIEALDGQLITNKFESKPKVENRNIKSDTVNDILKIVVVNRYKNAPVAKAFIKNFGFKKGAIASSVAHDSHNIIAAGVEDASLAKAINLIIRKKGGISCVNNKDERVLPLPVAGLMTTDDGYKVAEAYTAIDKMAKALGSSLSAPFMTLSFMALLVIPHLKLSDLGLFDGDAFKFAN